MTAAGQKRSLTATPENGRWTDEIQEFTHNEGLSPDKLVQWQFVRFARCVQMTFNPLLFKNRCNRRLPGCPVFQFIGQAPEYWTLLSSSR
jgi:hypothetical protein